MALPTIWLCDLSAFTQSPHTDHSNVSRLIPCVEGELGCQSNWWQTLRRHGDHLFLGIGKILGNVSFDRFFFKKEMIFI